ncbi:hypothetical protein PVAP13_9NG467656 [Panicum virgatum]|uniref:Uncharacterized protein n=1 Tax=Panicum virgatum TaxID=38727 RepID=A0A8T0MS13_PANVG|nr:hypothetical protein PVAP13_9NG467656 [Panicum virgatum]
MKLDVSSAAGPTHTDATPVPDSGVPGCHWRRRQPAGLPPPILARRGDGHRRPAGARSSPYPLHRPRNLSGCQRSRPRGQQRQQ